MTLNEMLSQLKEKDPNVALMFLTEDERIGGGYHVTELKSANITSIDCGGNVAAWTEASLQLLDGDEGTHMRVGKFVGILEHSLRKIRPLRDVPAHVEFSPGNVGLRRFEMEILETESSKAEIRLSDTSAACKPAASGHCGSGCTGKSEPKTACCS